MPSGPQATVYVPNWLHSIPKSMYDVPLPPLPLPVDPSQAADVFPLPLLQDPYPSMLGSIGLEDIDPPNKDVFLPRLQDNSATYLKHFTCLLAMEQEELRRAAGRQVIYGVPITRQVSKSGAPLLGPGLWQLRIPGTREDSPRLFIDDRLRIRGLYRQLETATETAVQARITGTIKREGLVFFECPALEAMDQHLRHHPSGGSHEYTAEFPALGIRGQPRTVTNHTSGVGPEYMVEFYPSTDALITMHNAVSLHFFCVFCYVCGIQRTHAMLVILVSPCHRPAFSIDTCAKLKYMSTQLRRVASCLASGPKRTPTHKWLFPALQDIKETMSRSDFELKPVARREDAASVWEETPLNEQQKLAIKRVVGSHRTVPYLIVGPPGTGKRTKRSP